MNNNMSKVFDSAFNSYFGVKQEDHSGVIAKENDKTYTYKEPDNVRDRKVVLTSKYSNDYNNSTADDNIDDVEQFVEILSKLLNAALGSDWGVISPDLTNGEDSSNIMLPQIVVDINNREITEGMPIKPVLTDSVKEVVDGKETGDTLLMYRQWFDCNIEFDFYGRTPKEVRQLMRKFESLLQVYAGYLKRQGISEIIFLKEMSPRVSLNFVENIPMKALVYYIRLERITPIRQSMINKINAEIGIKSLSNDKIQQVIEKNTKYDLSSEPAELDFDIFAMDTGTIYDINEN